MESTAPEEDEPPLARRRAPRELAIAAAALIVGVLLAPLLIFVMGRATLGPYRGGVGKLFADYLAGLGHGAPAFWAVALGPYVMTLLVRLVYFVVRRER